MRCNNCGWDNPASCTSCQKCNQPLEFSPLQQQSSNPRATMVDIQPQHVNHRATMADIQPVNNPRATVMEAKSAAIENQVFSVALNCLDDMETGEIHISSTRDLGLVSGDIIFLKKYRYQVK